MKKKFIKDWWPLLLIAGWWLWKKRKEKRVTNTDETPQEMKKFIGHICRLKLPDTVGGYDLHDYDFRKLKLTKADIAYFQQSLGEDWLTRPWPSAGPRIGEQSAIHHGPFVYVYDGMEMPIGKIEKETSTLALPGGARQVDFYKIHRSDSGYFWLPVVGFGTDFNLTIVD